MVNIKPVNLSGTYRTDRLINLKKADIVNALGFEPNADDDPDKVVNSWSFTIDGEPCAIWDYKGSHMYDEWSVFDPAKVIDKVFSAENIESRS